jgi:hypothetical protein
LWWKEIGGNYMPNNIQCRTTLLYVEEQTSIPQQYKYSTNEKMSFHSMHSTVLFVECYHNGATEGARGAVGQHNT